MEAGSEKEAGMNELETEAGMRGGAVSASKYSPARTKVLPLRQGDSGSGWAAAPATATLGASPGDVSEASAARAVAIRRRTPGQRGRGDEKTATLSSTEAVEKAAEEGACMEDGAFARARALQRRLEARIREVPPPPPPPPLSSVGGMAAVVAAAAAGAAKAGRGGGGAEGRGLLVLPGGGGVSAGFSPLRCDV